MNPVLPSLAPSHIPGPASGEAALREAARALEQTFLAEMLKTAGVAEPPTLTGGGAGEEAFAGFLVDAYAAELQRAGGLGLSESIFAALVARQEG